MMLVLAMILLVVNGIVAFAYNAANASDPAVLWALLSANFIYFLGITQSGIAFSAVMRLSRSGWGRQFTRIGEVITLSFIPLAAVVFVIIYLGGVDHIFYWAKPAVAEAGHGSEHISPWLGKGKFLVRNIITMAFFYIMSLIYFFAGRKEEKSPSPGLERRLRILAAFVCLGYVLLNTNVAWDFTMMIIKHWESSIIPPYFWAGNLLGGVAFLFLMYLYFVPLPPGERLDKVTLDSMGKVFIGFILLWVYMYWSQFVIFWYTNIPARTTPLFRTMFGSLGPAFIVMLLTIFIIPFLTLLSRKGKLCVITMGAVAILLCIGVWINRYLMVVPVFTDGSVNAFATYTGIALPFAGLSATVLSIMAFRRLFPAVAFKAASSENKKGH